MDSLLEGAELLMLLLMHSSLYLFRRKSDERTPPTKWEPDELLTLTRYKKEKKKKQKKARNFVSIVIFNNFTGWEGGLIKTCLDVGKFHQ